MPPKNRLSRASSQTPSIGARIRTVLMVTFLAVLIWLLAESRMVQTRVVELQIVLVGNLQDPEHRFVVRPASGEVWSASVDVELEGSLASLDEASRELRGRVQMTVGEEIPARPGDQDIDLRVMLRNLPALRAQGVSIRSLSKDLIRVQVDELISVVLPIRVDLPQSVAIDGPVRAIPQTITVTGPSSLVSTLDGREAFASPPPSAIAALTPGRLETIPSVAVTLPISVDPATPLAWVPSLSPSRADIRLTVRSLTQTTIIDRLPIQVLLAPGEVGRWEVTLNPGSEDLVSVQITGPADALGAIIDGTQAPSAVLSLSFQDLERAITTKQVQLLGLPDGVEVRTELPQIGFKIAAVPPPSTEQPKIDPASDPAQNPTQNPASTTP